MATTTRRSTRYKELGNSGVQIFNGIITGEEYNYNLMGRRALQTWDEMRRSDGTVKMTLRVLNEPVKAISYHVQPASDDEADLKVAEFVDAQLFDVLRWKTSLTEILTHLPFGFAVFEKVYGYDLIKGESRIYVKKLAFRKQASIAKWEAGDNTPGISQYGKGGDLIPIPLDRLIVFTNEQEGDNYEGTSVLRPAYKHWFYKDKLYQIDALSHERQGLGVVKVKHPKVAKDTEIKKAESAARNLRANEEASLTEPEGWEVDFMDMKANTTREPVGSIEHHDRQIPDSVLAGFMKLGSSTGSGSRAVGETQLKVLEQYVKSIADYIADTINRYFVKDIVDLNFNVTEYPKLVAGEVSGQSLTELAVALKNLVDAGFIDPTPEDEDYLRGILSLPERPDDAERPEDEPKPKSSKKAPEKHPEEEEEDTEKKNASVLDRARSILASIKGKLYGKSSGAS